MLRRGARVSQDKYGKTPMNDAAENEQLEVRLDFVNWGEMEEIIRADVRELYYTGERCRRQLEEICGEYVTVENNVGVKERKFECKK